MDTVSGAMGCTGRGKGDTRRAVETEARDGKARGMEWKGRKQSESTNERAKELGKKGGKRYFSWLDNNKTNSKQATNKGERRKKRGTGQEDNGQFKP